MLLGAPTGAGGRRTDVDRETLFTDVDDHTGLTVADIQAAEPKIGWVDAATASGPGNDYAVSMRVWN